jgi:hypothetical protein
MIELSRRSLFRGFAALLAAPAIARVTSLIPPLDRARLNYLTLHQITRESIKMFVETNAFMSDISGQYAEQFAQNSVKIGTQLRIRLPTDNRV